MLASDIKPSTTRAQEQRSLFDISIDGQRSGFRIGDDAMEYFERDESTSQLEAEGLRSMFTTGTVK